MNFNNDIYNKFWFDAMAIENDKMWFFANGFNALFETDLNNEVTKYLGSIPEEILSGVGLYFNMLKHGNKLYLVPANAENLAIFDLITLTVEIISVDLPRHKCFSAAIYDDMLIMFGCSSPDIVIYDLLRKKLKFIDKCCQYFKDKKIINDRIFFRKNNCVLDNDIYVVSCNSNVIIKYNAITEQIKVYELNVNTDGFFQITYDGVNFWISKWQGCTLFRWNEQTGEIEEFTFHEANTLYRIADIIFEGKKIIAMPLENSEYVAEFNMVNHKWGVNKQYTDLIRNENPHPWGHIFPNSVQKNGVLYTYSGCKRNLIIYDTNKNDMKQVDIFVKYDEIKRLLLNKNNIIKENNNLGLEDFLKMVSD